MACRCSYLLACHCWCLSSGCRRSRLHDPLTWLFLQGEQGASSAWRMLHATLFMACDCWREFFHTWAAIIIPWWLEVFSQILGVLNRWNGRKRWTLFSAKRLIRRSVLKNEMSGKSAGNLSLMLCTIYKLQWHLKVNYIWTFTLHKLCYVDTFYTVPNQYQSRQFHST